MVEKDGKYYIESEPTLAYELDKKQEVKVIKDNQDRPQSIRVYFAGMGCSGASFGIALDEEREDDVCYDIEGLHFIMSEVEYSQYGDVTIEDISKYFLPSAVIL